MKSICLTIILMFGMPILLPAQDDARWDDSFSLGGLNGYVQATAVASNGDVYVGGYFTLNNGVLVNHIARWDGENWHALGTGTKGGWYDGSVDAIVIDSNRVYVGGSFNQAGDITASSIAMWDGEAWHALGSGVTGKVTAIALENGNVYVGGSDISEAGGVEVMNVAKWDGQSWHAMGDGLTRYNYVNALVAHNDTVYAGGNFILSGTDTVNHVAMWDGSKWNDIGGGVDDTVFDLEYADGLLYVGGYFRNAGGLPTQNFAIWDGQKWIGFENGPNSGVYAIDVVGDDVYIGGQFQKVDTLQANRFAKWDGERWHTYGNGFNFTVNTVLVTANMIYAGGEFETSGNTELDYFAGWDGDTWSSPGKMPDQSVDNGEVNAIAVDGKNLYVGGTFKRAGGDTVNRIAMWDGKSWHKMGSGFDNRVNVIEVDSGRVYAGGAFGRTGDLQVNRIAMWDGEKWNALSTGMNNQVYTIAFHGKDVYVGGNFTSAGEIWARRIARWDGEKWHALGGDGSLNGAGGLDGYPNSYVTSIVVDQDTVYIGGFFASAIYQDSFIRVKSMAKWDGDTWYALAPFSDVNQQLIKSIYVEDARIYAAGSFPRIGGSPANKVVMWDGSTWSDIGDEFYYTASSSAGYTLDAVLKQNGTLYTAGFCDLAGKDTVNFIARFDGQNWVALGSGLNDNVTVLAADSNFVYAGGRFTIAGDKGSSHIARYNVTGISAIEDRSLSTVEDFTLSQNYPNPFNPITNIKFTLPRSAKVVVEIFNMLGQHVETLVDRRMPAGTHFIAFNGAQLASGLYLYRLRTDNFQAVKKMILLK